MRWFHVEPVGSPTNLIGDALWSIRKANPSATLCMRVRRSSDNAELDIGFDGNDLDTAALLAFTGASNGFVRTWYDQSGNGNDAEQSNKTYQPQIVTAGTVDTDSYNGKPNIVFNLKYLNAGNILGFTEKVNVFVKSEWTRQLSYPIYKRSVTNRLGSWLLVEEQGFGGFRKAFFMYNNASAAFKISSNNPGDGPTYWHHFTGIYGSVGNYLLDKVERPYGERNVFPSPGANNPANFIIGALLNTDGVTIPGFVTRVDIQEINVFTDSNEPSPTPLYENQLAYYGS